MQPTGLEPATRWLTAYWKPDDFIGFCCLGKDFSEAIGPEIDGDPSRRRFTLSCAGPIELLRSCAPVKYLIQTLVDLKFGRAVLVGPLLDVRPVQSGGLNGNYDSNIREVFVALPAKLLDDNIFGSWNDCFDL